MDDRGSPNPSWLMAKFWAAVAIGGVIYGVEKSIDWCRRRIFHGEANSKRT